MDNKKLDDLIKGGEKKNIDFKRELTLENEKQKSELIKDVIAIANSAEEVGYLIFGVDDTKEIFGCNNLPEERIQQIVHTYIEPAVAIDIVALEKDNKTISVINIRPAIKPYKVARDIDRLEHNTVYLRRGTVTFKASPEEMFAMRENQSFSLKSILLGFQNIFNKVSSGVITRDDNMERALEKAHEAVVKTQAYLRDGGNYALTRKPDEESNLANLWYEVSRLTKNIDKNLAQVCNLKAGYWSNVDAWDDARSEETDISLTNVEKLLSELLDK